MQWWKQANCDFAVEWAHFQSLEELSFDILNIGCSSLLTFTLSLCNSWVLSSRHSLMTVFLLSFLLPWECSKCADWPQSQRRRDVPHDCHKAPSSLLGHGEEGSSFQRVKAFSNTDSYLGHRKQHVGMNKKKKILFSFSVWHLPGGRKCRAHWKSYCWNSDQSVIKCHDLICQSCFHFQGQSLHLCVCVRVCVVSLCI